MEQDPQPSKFQLPKLPALTPAHSNPPSPPPDRPFSWWVRKFLACNPFYLVSAALLLYGVYLVSLDAGFFTREGSQLAFNFGALQFYELLLVATAIILARRRIWYDSVLLVGLENLLVLVPFILISQAALLDRRMVWLICVAGGIAAVVRFSGLKHFFKELNLPRRMLACGCLLLLVNFALPLIYKPLNDFKIGTKPTDGAAYEMNRYSWLVLLPAIFALFNLLPRPKQAGSLLPQRRWLPAGLFALWLAGSGVHLYCLSYVYNFDWEYPFAFPLLWVVAWTSFLRHADFIDAPHLLLSQILLVLPVASALPAMAAAQTGTFLALSFLNIVGYLVLVLRRREQRTALHLLLISFTGLVAGLALSFEPRLPAGINQGNWIIFSIAAYLMWWVIRSRNPASGLFGALIVAVGSLNLVANHALGVQVAAELALAFLLLHSLRWVDVEHPGAAALRIFVCAVWIAHAVLSIHLAWPHAVAVIYCAGGCVLAGWSLALLLRGGWWPVAVPVAAALVLLAQPGNFIAGKAWETPAGILAIMGSLILFALGTLAALTKNRWHPHAGDHDLPQPINSTQ